MRLLAVRFLRSPTSPIVHPVALQTPQSLRRWPGRLGHRSSPSIQTFQTCFHMNGQKNWKERRVLGGYIKTCCPRDISVCEGTQVTYFTTGRDFSVLMDRLLKMIFSKGWRKIKNCLRNSWSVHLIPSRYPCVVESHPSPLTGDRHLHV